jgi:transposase
MVIAETSMPADFAALMAYFKKHFTDCRIEVMYEAGFAGFGLHDQLVAAGIYCVVTPPNKVMVEKSDRVKNDRVDARRLAKNLENGDYKKCFVPDGEQREDRQISRTLIEVQKSLTALKNRIRKLFDFHGLNGFISAKKTWTLKDFRAIKDLTLSESLRVSLGVQLALLEQLMEHRRVLRKSLEALSKKQRYAAAFKRLESAPGVGWLTAIRLVLEWGEDLSRFESSKKFARFVGLTCSEHSTGESERKGRITGQSAPHIRAWLIQCAWIAIRRDPVLLQFYQRVSKNSASKKKAIVAVARKLAVRLWTLSVRNESYCVGLVA